MLAFSGRGRHNRRDALVNPTTSGKPTPRSIPLRPRTGALQTAAHSQARSATVPGRSNVHMHQILSAPRPVPRGEPFQIPMTPLQPNYQPGLMAAGPAFTTTHWSMVLAASADDSPQAGEALSVLCSVY